MQIYACINNSLCFNNQTCFMRCDEFKIYNLLLIFVVTFLVLENVVFRMRNEGSLNSIQVIIMYFSWDSIQLKSYFLTLIIKNTDKFKLKQFHGKIIYWVYPNIILLRIFHTPIIGYWVFHADIELVSQDEFIIIS